MDGMGFFAGLAGWHGRDREREGRREKRREAPPSPSLMFSSGPNVRARKKAQIPTTTTTMGGWRKGGSEKRQFLRPPKGEKSRVETGKRGGGWKTAHFVLYNSASPPPLLSLTHFPSCPKTRGENSARKKEEEERKRKKQNRFRERGETMGKGEKGREEESYRVQYREGKGGEGVGGSF